MANLFPKWINGLRLAIPIIVLSVGGSVVGGVWYFGSPRFTDVGYRPNQPVAYSHRLHAGDLGLDCRYCHVFAETSSVATLPPSRICMNCHTLVSAGSDKLASVRASWLDGAPIEWVRVHELPGYAYFDHSLHLKAGVGCASCHGRVDRMEIVSQAEPLSMGWCLDCHRDPQPHLRPHSELTNMAWAPDLDQAATLASRERAEALAPPQDCTGCHR